MSIETQISRDTAKLMVELVFYDDQAEGVAWVDQFECAQVEKIDKITTNSNLSAVIWTP